MGPSPGSHGCSQGPVASPVLGPTSFHGPGGQLQSNFSSPLGPPASGHQGQGFSVQCKHHQGCHSSIQSQQLMVGPIPSGSHQPMGPGAGSQHVGHQGTPWSSFPVPQQPSPQLPQQVLHQPDTSSNPLWSPQCGQLSSLPFPPSQPNPANPNQPKPGLQNTTTTPLCQLAPGAQCPQVPQGPQGIQHQSVYPGPQVPQAPQGPQVYQTQPLPATQGQASTVTPSNPTSTLPLDPSRTSTPPNQVAQAPTTTPPTLDLQALEQRLGATLEKGMESMAASLKSTLAQPTPPPSTPFTSTPTSTSPKPSTTVPTTAPTFTPVKAKPPTPPTDSSQQQQPSKNRLRSPLPREKRSSRRSRSRRRRRSMSKELPKKRHHESSSRKVQYASGPKAHAHMSSQKRHAPDRHTAPTIPKSSNPAPPSGRDKNHPIYRRSSTFHQVHQDGRSTVYKKEPEKRDTRGGYTPRSTSPSHPKESYISLRSRSRTRGTSSRPSRTRPYVSTTGQITLRPKPARKTNHGWDPPEVSASETGESLQVDIPQAEIEVDWRRPSQERDEEDEQDDLDDQMPIPKHQSMDEDWGISVKKAFDDTSRTKAPCEIPASKSVVLPTTISKRAYNNFAAALREHNPKAPQAVVENMASIFAQSGKMTLDQATGSYTFEVKSLELFGLFVPTNFSTRPPFDGNDSNVYHIIHGTTIKGASTILAEERIRPGDFTIHRDYAQCGYPSYGFYLQVKLQQKPFDFPPPLKSSPERS